MRTASSRTRILAFGALVTALLLSAGNARAQQTNALALLMSQRELATMRIKEACFQRKIAAQEQYEKALDALMKAQKQGGNLDAFLQLEAARKRFQDTGVVTDAEVAPALAAAYDKAIAAATVEQDSQTAAMLKKYMIALEALMKQLTQTDKISEAKAVRAERERVDFELAELQARLPKAAAAPTKRFLPQDAKAYNGHHYLFFQAPATWPEAKKACAVRGGHLVTITDNGENEFVYREVGRTEPAFRNVGCWLGLTDELQKGAWTWVTGELFLFAKWAKGEPAGRGKSPYAILWGSTDGVWSNAREGLKKGFVCEWDY